jgi:RNA 2',3'-cyclic 3'-phosphodiesterase
MGNRKPEHPVEAVGKQNHVEASVRAFIAIALPESIIAFLGKLQDQLKTGGLPMKWTRPENIHLTLKFLGDISQGAVTAAGDVIAETVSRYSPITLSASGIGVFPGIRRPNVLWTGISGQTDVLAALQRDLDGRLYERLGVAPEKRRFTGHLTLGRVKGRSEPDRFIEAMEKFGKLETEPFTADAVHLFRSRLLPSGPVYTRISGASLGK